MKVTKNINKRSDARSYSPLSFLGNSQTTKTPFPENIKNKQTYPELLGLPDFKTLSTINQLQNTNLSNYMRSKRKNNTSALNSTVIQEKSRRNSSCEDIAANISCIDVNSNKNVSQRLEPIKTTSKRNHSRGFNSKYDNPSIIIQKNNSNFGNTETIFPIESVTHNIENKVLNNRDNMQSKREEGSCPPDVVGRRNNRHIYIPPQNNKKMKEESALFPTIKHSKTIKQKDDLKSDKQIFIEKTYSLSPNKYRSAKPSTLLQNYPEVKINDTSVQMRTQDQFYKAKLPPELNNTGKIPTRGRPLQALSKIQTPKTQLHSPTDDGNAKNGLSVLLQKDPSWGTSSIVSNISQFKVNAQIVNNKSTIYAPPSTKTRLSRRLSAKLDRSSRQDKSSVERRDDLNHSTIEATPKQITDACKKELMNANHIYLTGQHHKKFKPAKRSKIHNKTQVELNERCYTTSNHSTSNILDSVDIGSHKHLLPNNTESFSPEIGSSPQKNYRQACNKDRNALKRQESSENVLDEFADRSVFVSVQDQYQSFAVSSTTGRGQFEEILETSLISYLNEKDTHDKSRKEIETTLSITKHPVFKRSKITGSKGLNSYDKDHTNVTSTNITNSKSTYKNDSVQLRNEFFPAQPSLEKSQLEIDFNFAEDIKVPGEKNEMLSPTASPSFPGPISSHKTLITNKLEGVRSGHMSKKASYVNKYDNFEIISVSQENSEDNDENEKTKNFIDSNSNLGESASFRVGSKQEKLTEPDKQSFIGNPMDSLNNSNNLSD